MLSTERLVGTAGSVPTFFSLGKLKFIKNVIEIHANINTVIQRWRLYG